MNGGVIACLVCLCIVGEVTAPAGPGSSVFVSPSGDDTKGDGTFSHPYRTIQRGVDTVADEGRVHVLPGRYSVSSGSHSSCSVVSIEGKSVTLEGSGCDETVLDGCGQCRAVHIHPGEIHVDILSVSIVNGSSVLDGGAVLVEGGGTSHVTFANTTFSHNTAMGSGGAVGVGDQAAVTFDECILVGNTASRGGAVFLARAAAGTILRTHLRQNTAIYGGAIFVSDPPSTLNMEDSVLEENAGNMGGAMSSTGQITIVRTEFVSNTAETIGGALVRLSQDTTGSTTITLSNFTRNVAIDGGAIHYTNAALRIVHSTFANNNALDGAGGALFLQLNVQVQILYSIFKDNTAMIQGGGAYAQSCSVVILSSTFLRNSAVQGGAIMANLNSVLVIFGGAFSDNDATIAGGAISASQAVLAITEDSATGSGDEPVFTHNTCSSGGGAVSVEYSNSIQFRRVTFQHNAAYGNGGGLQLSSCQDVSVEKSYFGWNLGVGGGGGISSFAIATHHILECIFEHNTVVLGSGGDVVVTESGAVIENCHFRRSQSYIAGSITVSVQAAKGAELTINNSSFLEPLGVRLAGAVFLAFTSKVTITNSQFTGCASPLGGVGVLTGQSVLVMEGCNVTETVSGGDDANSGNGAFWMSDETQLILRSCSLDANVGKRAGGSVLYFRGACVGTVVGCAFRYNRKDNPDEMVDRAVILAEDNVRLSIEETQFEHNVGGVMEVRGLSTVSVHGCTFLFNESPGHGTCLLLSGMSEGVFDECVFVENESSAYGAVLGVTDHALAHMEHCKASGNRAASGGVFYCNSNETSHVHQSNFVSNSAITGGGGVLYWDQEPCLSVLPVHGNTFHGNTGVYGNKWASSLKALQLSVAPPSQCVSGEPFDPSPSVLLIDFYGNQIQSEDTGTITLRPLNSTFSVVGRTSSQSFRGVATFYGAGVTGAPHDNYCLQFDSDQNPGALVRVMFSIVPCHPGGHLVEGRCTSCVVGEYGLDGLSCVKCPRHAHCPGGRSVVADPDYYASERPSANRVDIVQCDLGKCGGNNECHDEYMGFLCAECEDDLQVYRNRCKRCNVIPVWPVLVAVVWWLGILLLLETAPVGHPLLLIFVLFIQYLALLDSDVHGMSIMNLWFLRMDFWPACYLSLSTYDKFYGRLLAALILIQVAALGAPLWSALGRFLLGQRRVLARKDSLWRRVFHMTGAVTLVTLLPVLDASLGLWVCWTPSSGHTILLADASLECAGPAYERARGIGISCTCLWAILVGCITWRLVVLHRTDSDAYTTPGWEGALLRPLRVPFRQELSYFGAIILLEMTIFALLVRTIGDVDARRFVILLFLVASSILGAVVSPYRSRTARTVSLVARMTLVLVEWVIEASFLHHPETELTVLFVTIGLMSHIIGVAFVGTAWWKTVHPSKDDTSTDLETVAHAQRTTPLLDGSEY